MHIGYNRGSAARRLREGIAGGTQAKFLAKLKTADDCKDNVLDDITAAAAFKREMAALSQR